METYLANPARADQNERTARVNLAGVIEAIGTPRFADAFLSMLSEMSGVEYVHFFQMIGSKPEVLRSVSLDASGAAEQQADYYLSRKLFSVDPWVQDWARDMPEHPALFHVKRERAGCHAMRTYYDTMQVSDRVMVCGSAQEGIVGISLARSQAHGPFEAMDERLEVVRDFALPLFIKHRDFCWQRTKFSQELLDVAEMERRMHLAPQGLPRREIQVAARILRGLTASGIALDLGIGRETVVCYRKRLYEKLALGSYHDLLAWYIGCAGGDDALLIN